MEKKIQDARNILQQIGMPLSQQNDICVYTLLSLAGITDDSNWEEADNQWIGIHDILMFIRDKYGRDYAENTRETIRKIVSTSFGMELWWRTMVKLLIVPYINTD